MVNDKDLKDYIHRMLVPPGYRPQSDDDIEKTLDVFDEGPLESDTVSRILGKANGRVPLSHEPTHVDADTVEQTVESDELLALHRSAGDSESDDVKKKLEKYRQEAKSQDDAEDESENDVN